jgi:hypothetical protein
VPEGVLRKSFLRDGEYLDQALFAIIGDDWRASRDTSSHTSRDRWAEPPIFATMH